ncbi:MAG: urea ABC transporter ATP-binding subunit UrtE [Gammaproteobacteria bacterium]|nr:urea ABC transporter ATP-binding subunit UrtE [Gammaproteobacteria bacterium]
MLSAQGINHFYGGSHILRDVSLQIPAGTCTALLGRNGVGKSTLLKCLMGVLRVRTGRITFEGVDITALAPNKRARGGIAYVPQGREIFPRLTVEENLLTGLVNQKTNTSENQLSEVFTMFPVLQAMRHRRGGDLSGGQQQQLAIARALLTRPRLLILDEPTEGIQPSIIKDIEQVILQIKSRGDMSILLVEQYFDFACKLADQFAIMSKGEIILKGKGNELLNADIRQKLLL